MTPSRGDRLAPPPPADGYTVRASDKTCCDGWEQLCKQLAANMRVAYGVLAAGPHPPAEVSGRHHQLKGQYATRAHGGRSLPQWQYEVGSAARIWYVVDPDTRTVWITHAGTAHPAGTDGKVRR